MKTSLEQWIAFQAVVDQGSYAQAAAHLHKSQSTLSYAITRLEEQLGLELLKVEGRKAQLTPIGEVLLAHSRHLTAEVQQIEQLAKNLSSGWEHEIRLVADAACPVNYLMDVLRIFARDCPQSRIRLTEVVMSGGAELIHEGKADLAITAFVPSGLLADKLFDVEFIAVAHHEHPLNQFDRALESKDLNAYTHIVISDSAREKKQDRGWLGSDNKWTVTTMEKSLAAVRHQLGYAWLPKPLITPLIDRGEIRELNLKTGLSYTASMYLVQCVEGALGPGAALLAGLLKQHARCN